MEEYVGEERSQEVLEPKMSSMDIQWLKCEAKFVISLESMSEGSDEIVGQVEVNSIGDDDKDMVITLTGGGGKDEVVDRTVVDGVMMVWLVVLAWKGLLLLMKDEVKIGIGLSVGGDGLRRKRLNDSKVVAS